MNSRNLTPTHLNNCEEVYGDLGEVVPVDEDTVSALIGPWAILLPASLPEAAERPYRRSEDRRRALRAGGLSPVHTTKSFPSPEIIRLHECGFVTGRLNDIVPGQLQIESFRIEVPPDMWVSTGDLRALLGKRVWLAVINGQHRLAEMTPRRDF
ncbi:hypothetical protein [Methanothrix soehngenii]|mgnify:CR=1 FL=1|jgi:hypothetical protein|uniref:hypothetical protein n=1 Tax=Methanothrix soehngenii TaxID=2223 RepID=UPI002BCE8D14|nr:hypothetical protein [Methanothrix soehngenii]HNQ53752.1 hypothetical protein [Methanothrix soehngenii]